MLDDMALFAAVATSGSLTAAARELGVSKQTVSRRLTGLEESLGVQLVHRTTRQLALTEVGEAFAARCRSVVDAAEDARRAVTDVQDEPAGTLKVTADPHFGDAFLGPILTDYARRHPQVAVEVILTRRHVDLVAEGFDVAFRVGDAADPSLTSTRLGPARIRYCASPEYVAVHGSPRTLEELARHACVITMEEGRLVRWPFRVGDGMKLVTIDGRLRFTSFELTKQAVLGGLGIGLFPEYACLNELETGSLVAVLEDFVVEAGGVNLVVPTQRFLAARVRAFTEVAQKALRDAPWSARGQHEVS